MFCEYNLRLCHHHWPILMFLHYVSEFIRQSLKDYFSFRPDFFLHLICVIKVPAEVKRELPPPPTHSNGHDIYNFITVNNEGGHIKKLICFTKGNLQRGPLLPLSMIIPWGGEHGNKCDWIQSHAQLQCSFHMLSGAGLESPGPLRSQLWALASKP